MHSCVIRTGLRPLLLISVLLCLPTNEVSVAFWARSAGFAATDSSIRSAPERLDGRRIQGSHPGAIATSQPDSLTNKDLLGPLDNRVKPYFSVQKQFSSKVRQIKKVWPLEVWMFPRIHWLLSRSTEGGKSFFGLSSKRFLFASQLAKA